MKFLKWFFEDAASEVQVRAEYAQLPDKKLFSINPSELTPTGMKCYREELERRKALRPENGKAKN